MDWLTVLVLAVGLAMDAMAVSAARGLVSRRKREALLLALVFGAFQGAMPALGWWLGALVGPLFERWTAWIAAGLLAAIGLKMLWDARGEEDDDQPEEGPLTIVMLVTLGIATSIDAFAAGVSLTMLDLPFGLSIAIIGGMTAALSALGFAVARRAGEQLGRRLARFGGVILLLLAVKAVV